LIAFLGFGLIVAVGLFIFQMTASSELDRVVAELDRLDPGWRMEDFEAKRQAMPDAENSALRIIAAAQLLWGKRPSSPFQGMNKNRNLQVRLDATQAADIEKQLMACKSALEEARKLKDMPKGRWPTKFDTSFSLAPPKVQLLDALTVSRLLALDAIWRAHKADAEGALESCLAILHAGQSLDDYPVLMAYLVRESATLIAVNTMERTLAQNKIGLASEPTLQRLQDALAKELSQQMIVDAFRGERAFSYQILKALSEGTLDAKQIYLNKAKTPISELLEATLIDYVPGKLMQKRAVQLRFYTDIVELLKLPPEEWENQIGDLQERVQKGPIMVRKSVGYLLNHIDTARQTLTSVRCALVALAAERYRISHNHWPDSLDVLVNTGYLDAISKDLYGGKPLRLKRTADSLIIYSVWPNSVDVDNGAYIESDLQQNPPRAVGFRLWDLNWRGQRESKE